MNLSNYETSEADLTLLEKGLSFVPNRKTLPISNIIKSRDDLIRRLKLKDFFEGKKSNRSEFDRLFIEKSSFIPNDSRLTSETLKLAEEIDILTEKILNKHDSKDGLIRLNTKNNLSESEFKAIKQLKNNNNIIIKPADKGGATVIMNRGAYLKEAYRQLNDKKYYIRPAKPLYHDSAQKIKDILRDMNEKSHITDDQFEYLSGPTDYKPRNIYFLPKIHKERNKWPWPDMPEARPICSDIQSETHRISSYIDYFLNPLASKHPSFIKNSYEFVNKIRNFKFNKNWMLVTGDVSALYTNMHHDRTINGVKKSFENNPQPGRPDSHILHLLDIILKNNDFVFNNETFLQVLGTAMGKVFSPSLANLYLLDFDEKAMNGFFIKPLLFFRYLDDVFLIWPGSLTELKEYETFLNSLIPDIKINLEFSNTQISFLDVSVYVEEDLLKTRTFFKQTDTHQLLHTSSFHPKHTTIGLIKSQLIRFKRLSSSALDYNQTCKILFGFLKHRGYSLGKLRKKQFEIWFNYKDKYCITEPINENNDKCNNQIATNRIKKDGELIPIIVDFCAIGSEIARGYKDLLIKTFNRNKFNIVTAYKNSQNLRQMLIKSKLANVTTGAFIGCDQPRCITCKFHAAPKNRVVSCVNNRTISVRCNISCSSINVIYIITCRKCKMQYVGETGRSLRDRVNDHRSAIRNKSDTPISWHFAMKEHSVADLSITPIDIVENVFIRRKKEKALQKYLKTIHPEGINNLPSN